MIRNGHWLDCRWMNVITLIWCPKFHVIAFFLLLFLSIISCSFARNLTASSAGGAGIQRSATAIKQLLLNWCKSKTQEYEVHAKPISLNQQHNDDGQIVYRKFMLYAYQWNGKSELQSYLDQSSLVTCQCQWPRDKAKARVFALLLLTCLVCSLKSRLFHVAFH